MGVGRLGGAGLGLLWLGLLGCGSSPPVPAPWTEADSLRVEAILAPLIARHEFMGAVVLVRHGQVVYARGAGSADVARNIPFTPSTPADGGSLAKTFTAAAVWELVDEGRVALDTVVTAYVPEYPYPGTTVRQLLTHSNGLPPYYEAFDPYFAPGHVRTTTDLLAVVRREMPTPRFPPGERFEYSNLGWDVAALVVERVTGQRIEDFFRQRFFAPLRLTTAFARPGRFADWPGPRTLGYRWKRDGWEVADVYDGEAFIGASNLYLSALDVARWAAAHADGGVMPAAVHEHGQPPSVIAGQVSAISARSWYCDESGARCHYGGTNNAFQSLAYWDRDRREAVAMVSNSGLPARSLIALQRDLVAALAGLPADGPAPEPLPIDSGRLVRLVGRYAWSARDTLVVSGDTTGLRWRIGTGLETDLFVIERAALYLPSLDLHAAATGDSLRPSLHVRSLRIDRTLPRLNPPAAPPRAAESRPGE